MRDNAGNIGEGTIDGKTENVIISQEGNINISEPIWDSNTHTASVTLSKGTEIDTNLKIQYQINDYRDDSWIEGITVAGIQHNQTVYARLIDTTGQANGYASWKIVDSIDPTAEISLDKTEITTDEIAIATVRLIDNQSGIDLSNCKWELSTESVLGTDDVSRYTNSFDVSKGENQEISIGSTESGTYYLHVLVQDNAGRKVEVIATQQIIIKMRPTSGEETPGATSFSTAYGTIDIIWLDKNDNVISSPNAPELEAINNLGTKESMIPVTWTYDGTTEKWIEDATAKSDWYNYEAGIGREENKNSRWANAKTNNGSYFVWIPRYAYRITYYENETSTTPTGYCDGYGMWNAKDTTVINALSDGIKTKDYNGEKYIIHPAFCDGTGNGYENGEWDTNLGGFWFAKYEMSGSSTELKSVPNVSSLISRNIGNQYVYSRNATYGYEGKTEKITSGGTLYEHTSFMNSHLVKNSEWGAVAYLTHSQYGRNGHEISVNQCTGYITGAGRGTGTKEIYNSTYSSSMIKDEQRFNGKVGVLSSTTGNVYGIYDMSGGAYEYAASYDKEGSISYVSGSAYGLYMTQEAKDSDGNYISTKYVTAYSNGTKTYYGSTVYQIGKNGDSTKEVYKGSENGYNGWYYDTCIFATSDGPFFNRGGYYSGSNSAGVFHSQRNQGAIVNTLSSRAVLCP